MMRIRKFGAAIPALFIVACSGNSADSLNLEPKAAADPEIQAFLNSPDTTIFADDGLEWTSKKEYLLKGKVINGGCNYEYSGTTKPNTQNLRPLVEEIAVNRKTCVSLVREGMLSKKDSRILNFIDEHSKGGEYKGESNAAEGASQGESDTDYVQKKDAGVALTDSISYKLNFTDANEPVMSALLSLVNGALNTVEAVLLNIVDLPTITSGLPIGSVSIGAQYKYYADDFKDDCVARIPQSSDISGKFTAGSIGGWQVLEGGSCKAWNQVIDNKLINDVTIWDTDGSNVASDDLKSFCNTYIPEHAECKGHAPDPNYSYTTTIGSAAEYYLYSNASKKYIFDCSMGVYINVRYIYAYAFPRSEFNYDANYNVTGGEGGEYPCKTNIKAVLTPPSIVVGSETGL